MTTSRLLWKPLAAAGLASGLAQVATGIVQYVSGYYFVSWSGFPGLIVLAAGIVIGVRWYSRRVANGGIAYLHAWLAGAVISVVTAFVYVAYNVISISFVYPNFLEDMTRALAADGIAGQPTLASVVLSNLIGLSVRGTVIAALAAIALRKSTRGS